MIDDLTFFSEFRSTREIKDKTFYVAESALSDEELYTRYLQCEVSEGGHAFWGLTHFEDTGVEEFYCRHCKLIEK